MKHTKLITSLMAAGMAAASVTVHAATDGFQSIIDPMADCSLTIVKLKTTDSTVRPGTGFADPAIAEEGMQGIVFSTKKIASISNRAYEGKVETFYTDVDADYLQLLQNNGISVPSVTVGDTECYRSSDVSAALDAMNGVSGDLPGEVQVNSYVAENGSALPATDEDGMAYQLIDAENQGLYLVAETDYSAYSSGENVMASEVVYKPSSPFFVSIPMTGQTAFEDEDGIVEANTYWIYDVTVYPKNQTVSIPKYIVSPADGNTLEQTEDMEFGIPFQEIITASAPAVSGANNAYEKYIVTDTMDPGMTFVELNSVRIGNEVSSPSSLSAFDAFTVLTKDTDYVFAMDENTNSFSIRFLDAGLARLNALTMNAQVLVDFKVMLNENADAGNAVPTENTPSLTWKNRSTVESSVDGNKPKAYSYRIHLTKTGVEDGSNVSFVVRQGKDEMHFVCEEPGVYHPAADDENAETELSPAEDGTLAIRGLDEGIYLFEETKTENGHDLLSTRFTVALDGKDPTDGILDDAELCAVDINGNAVSDTAKAQITDGTAFVTVVNNESIVLHTGGSGTAMFYLFGGALTAAGFLLAVRRRRTI